MMSDFEKIKSRSRDDLKKFFRNGEIPSENHFCTLIDSMINKQDDGFSRDEENGMIISSTVETGRFLTLFKNIDDLDPFFILEKDDKEDPALRLSPAAGKRPIPADDHQKNGVDEKSIFFHATGNVGLGKRSDERYKLDVKGFAAMESRVGTYKQGHVPANGQWQTIVANLDNCQAFEVVARTGIKDSGRFAIVHALALSTYGKSSSRIRRTAAHYGFFWNRLRLRWKSNKTHDYELQIKTGRNYGEGVQIYYQITRLWDDLSFLPDTYYNSVKKG
jgi:hypothetical protein